MEHLEESQAIEDEYHEAVVNVQAKHELGETDGPQGLELFYRRSK